MYTSASVDMVVWNCQTKWHRRYKDFFRDASHLQTTKCVTVATSRHCHTSLTPAPWPTLTVVYNVYTLHKKLLSIGWHHKAPRHIWQQQKMYFFRERCHLTDLDLCSCGRDPDDVSHCQLMLLDEAGWRFVQNSLCRWWCSSVAGKP